MSRFLKVVVNIILLGAILVAASLLVPPIAGRRDHGHEPGSGFRYICKADAG